MALKVFDVLDEFNARMAKAQKNRKEKEKTLKKRVAEFEGRIVDSQKKLDQINIQIEGNEKEYRDLLKAEIDEKAKLEEGNALLKKEHKKGKITLNQFMAQKISAAKIETLARSKIAGKVREARLAVRDIAVERLKILADIEYCSNKISIIIKEFWREHLELLNREKEGLEKYQSFIGSSSRWETDYQIAQGGVVNAKIFNVKSWEELEMLPITGLIQPKHFPEFDRMILDLRGHLDFEKHKLALSYRAGKMHVFPEGFDYAVYDKYESDKVVKIEQKRPTVPIMPLSSGEDPEKGKKGNDGENPLIP
jgi:hypothetical protein